MEEITIYKFQLEKVKEALRLTANINKCHAKTTCFDRQVMQSIQFINNALEGKKDEYVPYV